MKHATFLTTDQKVSGSSPLECTRFYQTLVHHSWRDKKTSGLPLGLTSYEFHGKDPFIMEVNPYAPPQADLRSTNDDSNAEALRWEHINTEATIKSVGVLYYLGALVMIGLGISGLSGLPVDGETDPRLMGAVFAGLGLAQGFVGYGLRRLRGWTRIPTLLFSLIGLFGFPIGTLINAYIIYQVMSARGKFVTSPEYQAIIAATPHLKRKTSVIVRVLLIVLLVILVGAVILGFMSSIE